MRGRVERGGTADRALVAIGCGVTDLLFRLRVEGRVPPPGSPLLVAANHLSYLDPLVLGAVVARARRLPRFLVTPGAFEVPFAGGLLAASSVIPAGRGSVEAAVDVLGQGGTIVLYPEAHLPVAGRVHRARLGVATIARRSGAPVLPVALWGMQRERSLGWMRRRAAAVVIGAPLHCVRADRAEAERVLGAIRSLLPRAVALSREAELPFSRPW